MGRQECILSKEIKQKIIEGQKDKFTPVDFPVKKTLHLFRCINLLHSKEESALPCLFNMI